MQLHKMRKTFSQPIHMRFFVTTIVLLLFIQVGVAQENHEKEFLKQLNAKKIEWIKGEPDLAKVKMKATNKWGIYGITYYEDLEQITVESVEYIAPIFDSIDWYIGSDPCMIVKDKNKYGLIRNGQAVHDKTANNICKYDAIKLIENEGLYYSFVQENNKWGLIDWSEGKYIVDPVFENLQDVPYVWIDPWEMDNFQQLKKKLSADIIIYDKGNGDGVFKARNQTTKKWGMYQSLGAKNLVTLIPAAYDSLMFFPFNGHYTIVYNDGKMGAYLSFWRFDDQATQTIPCIYEDYKRFSADDVPKLAMMKNGKWGWVDWMTGEEKSEFIYETSKDLPYPYYEQKIWLEKE